MRAEPPSGTRMLASTPSVSASYTTVALSVSISASGSPRANDSPGSFSQWRMVASSIESDSFGMVRSRAISP